MIFNNRSDAGRQLAKSLARHWDEDVVVVGLPRGGVVVAHEISKYLGKPLDILIVQKLSSPANPELGIGALTESNYIVLNNDLIRALNISDSQLDSIIRTGQQETDRKIRLYRGKKKEST